jgi:flagellar biogenesis protein FliO
VKARALAAALTLAAIPLTTTALAFADEPFGPPAPEASVQPAAPPAPASTGTPLQMKPTKEAQPLVLAHDAPISWSTKAMLMLGVAGVGFLVWKRKKDQPTAAAKRTLAIAARASVGVRSELLLVDVDGQTLLLGVTPSSITRLSILGETPVAISELDSDKGMLDRDFEPGFTLPAGGAVAPLARILERTAEKSSVKIARREEKTETEATSTPAPAPRRSRARKDQPLEGQVRGLAIRSQG